MEQREINHQLVGVIHYDYVQPNGESADAVYDFTHSLEINAICAGMLSPHTLTPVDKATLEQALDDYLKRRSVAPEDEERIRAWLTNMPDEVAIVEAER